jgi:serine protease
MPIRLLLPAVAAAFLAAAAPASASPPAYVPDEVIVRYDDATRAERAAVQERTGTGFERRLIDGARTLAIEDGETVSETLGELRAEPDVEYAVPDYLVHAADFVPNDPGRNGPGGWRDVQWNFSGPFGVNAPRAWELARQAGAPGGRGVVVGVMDSGAAYENRGRFRRAPDLYAGRFVAPYDFVENDRHANDEESHGTHVTGTIAQKTNNGRGVTGLAYGVKIMPLKILDAEGGGQSSNVVRALRYAVRHGADVVNMSVEYDPRLGAAQIPNAIEAFEYARRKGVVLVAASGNEGDDRITYPARSPDVTAVGATTVRGCVAEFSNVGAELDLVAPGGGDDALPADNMRDRANCRPGERPRSIWQETFYRGFRRFRLVPFDGTSFAAPHVAAAAALVIGSGRLGRDPSPAEVERRLEETAQDLGADGPDERYGAGLLDVAAALAP